MLFIRTVRDPLLAQVIPKCTDISPVFKRNAFMSRRSIAQCSSPFQSWPIGYEMVSPVDVLSLEVNITCLGYSESSDSILIGDSSGHLHTWHLSGLRELMKHEVFRVPRKSSASLRTILCLQRNLLIVQGPFNENVRLMSLDAKKWILKTEHQWPATNHMGFCKAIDICATKAALPHNDSDICIRDVEDKNFSKVLKTPSKVGMLMSLASNEDLLLAGYEDRTLMLWHSEKNEVLNAIKLAHTPLDLAVDNRLGLAVGSGHLVQVFKIDDGTLELCLDQDSSAEGNSSVAIRPKSESKEAPIVATGSWDHTVRLYSWRKPTRTLKPLGALKFHKDKVECVITVGKWVVAGSKDGVVSVWNVY